MWKIIKKIRNEFSAKPECFICRNTDGDVNRINQYDLDDRFVCEFCYHTSCVIDVLNNSKNYDNKTLLFVSDLLNYLEYKNKQEIFKKEISGKQRTNLLSSIEEIKYKFKQRPVVKNRFDAYSKLRKDYSLSKRTTS